MKIKQKQLGIISYLLHQPISKNFDAKRIFQFAKAANDIRQKLDALSITEINVGKKYIENFDGTFKREQIDEYNKFQEEMKEIYEQEIEIVDIPKFRLSEWKDLNLTSFQIAELIDMGIIIEE